jgi:hypothetical protein
VTLVDSDVGAMGLELEFGADWIGGSGPGPGRAEPFRPLTSGRVQCSTKPYQVYHPYQLDKIDRGV